MRCPGGERRGSTDLLGQERRAASAFAGGGSHELDGVQRAPVPSAIALDRVPDIRSAWSSPTARPLPGIWADRSGRQPRRCRTGSQPAYPLLLGIAPINILCPKP